MNISDLDAAAVETAVAAFAPDADFATAIGALSTALVRYQSVLAGQDPDGLNRALGQLQRVSPSQYLSVLQKLPPAQQQAARDFVATYRGTALPGRPVLVPITTLRATPPGIKPGVVKESVTTGP